MGDPVCGVDSCSVSLPERPVPTQKAYSQDVAPDGGPTFKLDVSFAQPSHQLKKATFSSEGQPTFTIVKDGDHFRLTARDPGSKTERLPTEDEESRIYQMITGVTDEAVAASLDEAQGDGAMRNARERLKAQAVDSGAPKASPPAPIPTKTFDFSAKGK